MQKYWIFSSTIVWALRATLWAGVEGDLANVEVVIENEVIIAPASDNLRAFNMVRGPDGVIWINTGTTDPGLFKSIDEGRSWTSQLISLADVSSEQYVGGFYVNRDGRLWIVHQVPPTGGGHIFSRDVFVSVSQDQGKKWQTTRIDFGSFAPGAPEDPYTKMQVAWCHPNFVERTDGTVMVSASMRYPDWEDYSQADQSRPGIRDVMIRTKDGGKTWGDPTIVHQHATETAYAVDPRNPDRILAATRIQRKALPGEDLDALRRLTGMSMTPPDYMPDWAYKNGLLIESTDGGRSFREVSGGLFGFSGYRWSILWTRDNWLILASAAGQDPNEKKNTLEKVLRVSLDGGRSWLNGTSTGTLLPAKAKKFVVVPAYRDVGNADHYSNSVPATVELSRNRFLTLCSYKRDKILKGRFWYLADVP